MRDVIKVTTTIQENFDEAMNSLRETLLKAAFGGELNKEEVAKIAKKLVGDKDEGISD